jgi:hypothetical protein
MSTEDKLADTIRRGAEDSPNGLRQPFFAMKAVLDRFVVIDRNDLPKVGRTEHSNWWLVEGNPTMLNTGGFPTVRAQALAALAAAEYMDTHPPVDEEAVRAVARTMWPEVATNELEYNARIEVARRLVADGWTKP